MLRPVHHPSFSSVPTTPPPTHTFLKRHFLTDFKKHTHTPPPPPHTRNESLAQQTKSSENPQKVPKPTALVRCECPREILQAEYAHGKCGLNVYDIPGECVLHAYCTHRWRSVRCARTVRKVGYLGLVFPDGQGDRSNYCVPVHRTIQTHAQSKNSDNELKRTMFHTENATLLSESAVFAPWTYVAPGGAWFLGWSREAN